MAPRWTVSLREVLEAVEDFGSASHELIAWEYDVPPAQVRPVWDDAIAQGLIGDGTPDQFGELMWGLTAAGRARLAALHAAHPEQQAPGAEGLRPEGSVES